MEKEIDNVIKYIRACPHISISRNICGEYGRQTMYFNLNIGCDCHCLRMTVYCYNNNISPAILKKAIKMMNE